MTRADFTGSSGRPGPSSRGPADRPGPGRLRRTPPRALVMAALFGAVVGWGVVTTADLLGLTPPLVPWLTPAALWVAAIVIGCLAWALHRRLRVRRLRIDPSQAVTYLALAKASALAGAFVAGGYLAFGIMFVGRWQAESPRERVIRSGVAVLAAVALMIGGLLMERACEVPRSGRDDERGRDSDGDRADGDGDRAGDDRY